jgi:D-beta-D-heptose 7-phosphate kinase/D-beta-D-heptose 1-phosphate adenosyltransferase
MVESGTAGSALAARLHLDQFCPRVLVLGDVILDHFVFGRVRRISPEAPVPLVSADHERFFPGGAANVMANLASLGADVRGLAAVGIDAESSQLIDLLESHGVRTDEFVREQDRTTPRKCRVVAEGRHALRIDFERVSEIDHTTFELLARAAQRIVPNCDAVVLSDYRKGTLPPVLIQSVVALARDHGRPVIVDPKGNDASRYSGATVLTPNQTETEALTGMRIDDEWSLERAARSLRRTTGVDWVLVTRAEQGMALLSDTLVHIPALPACACDVSGAGDTVVAALAFALAGGLSVPASAAIANALAARVVERPGVATVSRADLLSAADDNGSRPSVVATQLELQQQVERLRRLGRRIVFTNGCFDVLHSGHVRYLEQSRALGDVLIVALNSDAGVARLKGPGRPVNSQADRARVLAGLRCVDFVVVFDEDTPYDLIRTLCPDVLTKGGDYEAGQVVGHDLVPDTRVLAFVPGRSTSAILESIRGRVHIPAEPVEPATSAVAAL